MEKIYMEENKRQSRKIVDFSVVLSFAVAFFAIISLATFGVVSNQGMDAVSYAAPIGTTTGNSFTFTLGKNNESQTIKIRSTGSGGYFLVPIYLVDNDVNKPVFCVEHNVDSPGDGDTVTKSDDIEDYGLLYILNHSYANGNPVTNITTNKELVEEWITQTAIWMYLYETQGNVTANGVKGIEPEESNGIKIHYINDDDLAAIRSAVQLDIYNPAGGGLEPEVIYSGDNLYTKYVAPLVAEARNVSGSKFLSVTKASGDVSTTTDKKYYQSTLITVLGNPSEDLINYDVTLSGIDGAFIVDEEGKNLSTTGIPGTKGFYVRIPAEKVTETVQTVTVDVVGHFTTLAGNYFVSEKDGDALQKVITVTGTSREVPAGTRIDFVGTPDTGMNTAQTIYFIGLIVLLCGVGIVYANAKPVESKQQ